MTLPHISALAGELKKLRELYEGATPRQRYKVALDRINNPTAHPNELVTRVSAVEAYARSLIANHGSSDKKEVLYRHRKFSRHEATSLVIAYLKIKATTPNEHFGEELWEFFRLAVNARNLLVHECTYLDSQKYLPLAESCIQILFGLEKLGKAPKPKTAT